MIARFGARRINAAGLILLALSVMVGLAGIDVMHYWLLLILLGIGWNLVLPARRRRLWISTDRKRKTRCNR